MYYSLRRWLTLNKIKKKCLNAFKHTKEQTYKTVLRKSDMATQKTRIYLRKIQFELPNSYKLQFVEGWSGGWTPCRAPRDAPPDFKAPLGSQQLKTDTLISHQIINFGFRLRRGLLSFVFNWNLTQLIFISVNLAVQRTDLLWFVIGTNNETN